MKRWLMKESANLVCALRMFGSVAILFIGIIFGQSDPKLALMYALLLISDLFDGYLYRKYVMSDPPRHWFNRLPVTFDPLSDLVFTVSGSIYVLYGYGYRQNGIICALVAIVLIALILSIMINRCQGAIKHIATFLLVYSCYGLMVLNVAGIWSLCNSRNWLAGFVSCMVTFYLVFFTLVPRERWLRY